MKKRKILSYSKQKEFYLLLLIGFITVFSMSALFLTNNNKNKDVAENKTIDLNESSGTEEEEPVVETATINNDNVIGEDNIPKISDTELIVDNVANSEEAKAELGEETVEASSDNVENVAVDKTDEVTTTSNTKKSSNLTYKESQGLSWPIKGNVILPYSMESSVYFETLDQYKCNPAICIQGMIDSEVLAAASGKIEKIETIDETGLTVTIYHGNDYRTVYGQLKDVKYNEGDIVEEGSAIALLSQPTIYYTREGSNLYFKVMKKDKTINPLNLLK